MDKKAIVREVLQDILDERKRQDEKWGDQSDNPTTVWLAIAGEEYGEVAQAILHDIYGGKAAGTLENELVQLAAVCVQWLESIKQNKEGGNA